MTPEIFCVPNFFSLPGARRSLLRRPLPQAGQRRDRAGDVRRRLRPHGGRRRGGRVRQGARATPPRRSRWTCRRPCPWRSASSRRRCRGPARRCGARSRGPRIGASRGPTRGWRRSWRRKREAALTRAMARGSGKEKTSCPRCWTRGSACSAALRELLTPDHVSALTYEHLLAGSATTSFTLASTTYLIAGHPEVEAKLLEEVDRFGQPGAVRPCPLLKTCGTRSLTSIRQALRLQILQLLDLF
jgi:hypothetical protein